MNNKVLVAMSGGVDSSVAALLLKQQGYECIGATMRLLPDKVQSPVESNEDANATASQSNNDAANVCEQLDIPYYEFDFSNQFKECVIDKFVNAYEKGLTPNPCIECNKYLKFGMLYKKAKELGCDHIATGHYAVIDKDYAKKPDPEKREICGISPEIGDNTCYFLKRAKDRTKDQSYFLYQLTQEQLSHTLFPLGGYTKDEIRKIAEENGFVNANRCDSQDICFIPDGKYADFIKNATGKDYPEGDYIDTDGNVLGRHKGIIHYTIGQRKGLGIALNEPMYVKEVDPVNNTVMLARDDELFSEYLIAGNLHFISKDLIFIKNKRDDFGNFDALIRCTAKIRYRHIESVATVFVYGDIMKVIFNEPQRAITKGQAVVLYINDYVVGGGTIL